MAGIDLSCFLDPGACIDSLVASWLAWFPFGMIGMAFTAGLVIGAILGKVGVGVVIALVLALKVAGKTPELHEHVVGKDAAPPIPKLKKKGKSLF